MRNTRSVECSVGSPGSVVSCSAVWYFELTGSASGVMVQWLQPQVQCGSGGGNGSLCDRVVV